MESSDAHKKRGVEDKPLMNRRSFLLGGLAAAAGSTLLPVIEAAFHTDRAYAVEVKDGMAWKEGLAALRRDVFYTPNETHAWYTEGSQSMWRRPLDLGTDRGTKEQTEIEDQFAEHIASSEKLHDVLRAHTHAFASLAYAKHILPTAREAVMRKESPPPIAPPSISDALLHIWTSKRRFESKHIPFKDLVLDPSGMWRMSLKNGMFSATVFEIQMLIREKIPEAIDHSDLSREDRDTLLDCAKSLDSSCVQKYNISEVTRLFESYYGINMSAGELFFPMDAYGSRVVDLQKQSMNMQPHERQEKIKEVIDAAQMLDIKLTFEPYPPEEVSAYSAF
ncbi:MAG: hypothetical protein Q8R25_02280 [bacterium]|nr:hypothetical protein [bacterium]